MKFIFLIHFCLSLTVVAKAVITEIVIDSDTNTQLNEFYREPLNKYRKISPKNRWNFEKQTHNTKQITSNFQNLLLNDSKLTTNGFNFPINTEEWQQLCAADAIKKIQNYVAQEKDLDKCQSLRKQCIIHIFLNFCPKYLTLSFPCVRKIKQGKVNKILNQLIEDTYSIRKIKQINVSIKKSTREQRRHLKHINNE